MTAVTQDGPLPYAELLPRLEGLKTEERLRSIVKVAVERGVLKLTPDTGDLPRGLTQGRGNVHYVEIVREAGCVVGVTIGRTYFAIGAADPNGQLFSINDLPEPGLRGKERERAREHYRMGQVDIHQRPPAMKGRSLLKKVADETHVWLARVNVDPEEIRGVTLSLPAPVSTTEGRLLTRSIAKDLGVVQEPGREFKNLLGPTNFPNLGKVIVANDADVAARGEVRYGKAYGQQDVVVVHAAYGIGAGVVTNGGVLRTGAGGGVGEVGHVAPRVYRDKGKEHGLLALRPAGDEGHQWSCQCGADDHLDALAGGDAIVERITASLDALGDETPNKLRRVIQDGKATTADKLDALLKTAYGPTPWKPARAAFDDAAHLLGGAIHTLTHLFKPEAVYLSGKLSEAGAPFLREVQKGAALPGSLDNYDPSIELCERTSEFGRRLIMVRGAAMTAVRGTPPLITRELLEEIEFGRPQINQPMKKAKPKPRKAAEAKSSRAARK